MNFGADQRTAPLFPGTIYSSNLITFTPQTTLVFFPITLFSIFATNTSQVKNLMLRRSLCLLAFAGARALQQPAAKYRRVLLARHGETNFNAEGRIQGTLDSSFLNLNGVTQAGELGKYLSVSEGGTIRRVWVSPMTRARQTLAIAQAVMEGAGYVVPDATVNSDLREIEVSGKNWQQKC